MPRDQCSDCSEAFRRCTWCVRIDRYDACEYCNVSARLTGRITTPTAFQHWSHYVKPSSRYVAYALSM